MANIDTKEQFGQAYTDLLSSHNYRGLVDLLSNTTFDSAESKYQAKKLINQFTEQADIEDKILEGANDDLRKAYNFVISGPSRTNMLDVTSPDYRFMSAWNSLADDNNIIHLKLGTEEVYNKFLNSLGGEDYARQKGISFEGNYGISFPADIQDKINIYKAMDNSGMYNQTYSGAAPSQIQVNSPGVATTAMIYTSSQPVNTSKEREAFINMKMVVDKANTDYEELLSNVTPYINEMVVSGYMGEDDKQLQQALANGMVELNVFKEMRSILEEKYNRVLQTKSLSQYDVWAMDEDNEGSQVLQKLDDPMLKNQLDLEINEAIADKRLHFSHASNGIDIGTMLVIDPAKDNKGNVIGDSKPRRIFVKDLFRSQAENALRDDTQIDAQMQYAKHQTYKHAYRGTNGFTITDWDQTSDSAVYTDLNGVKQVIGKAEALNIIDDDIIVRRMVDYYEEANKTDQNGRGYTQEYYRIYGNRGFNSSDLYDNISAKCLAVAANKYKGQSEQYIKYKAQELISSIMKGLGLNIDSEITDNNGKDAMSAFFGNRGIAFN